MTFALLALLFYATATALLVRALSRGVDNPTGWTVPAVLAILAHAGFHLAAWHAAQGLDLHFFAALSLVGLGMAGLTTLFGAVGRMAALGVVVFPMAALSLLGYAGYGHTPPEGLDWRLQLHAWCALLAYATLAIAAILAVMLWAQEHALRRRQFHDWLRALPPLTELESLLFRTITVGFVLLTATLLTGVLFVESFFDQQLLQKTVFSVLSWLLFGGLLLGRWRYGWRGATAVRWTLSAMALLVLAFFGMLELMVPHAR
jgi:ABC-type uncharacterized transport system permease subunit